MTTFRRSLRAYYRETELQELKAQQALENLIAKGPPSGSGISIDAWEHWHRYGFVACPGSKFRRTCGDPKCSIGAACRELRALGLTGYGSPLPWKQRPICGARNRQNEPCGVRVEPGKRRCRFHGGRSTGPKSPEGRARIAAAQRARWAAYRLAKIDKNRP